jgi:hypothetical protein
MNRTTRHIMSSACDASQLPRLGHWLRQRHRRNAVFVHVPKTAGKTVAHELDVCKLVSMPAVRFRAPWCGRLSFGHMHYPTLCHAGHVPESFRRTAFTFAFVRNSWDRMVSLYHYLQDKPWGMHPRTSFRSFLYLVRDHAYEAPGLFNASGLSQAASQLMWIRDGDREFTDFVGRYETLAADLATVAGELGCRAVTTRTWINMSSRGHYRDYYDPELRGLVAKVYEQEIDRFAFRF